jgi:nucleotide-binding universal stress UspA family protein
MADFQTIVVTTDFSDAALPAVKTAAVLAKKLGSRLILLYAVQDRLPPLILAASELSVEEIVERHRRRAEQSLAEYSVQHLPELEVELQVLAGVPHQVIVDFARERQADLIAMGTHGHGVVTHLLSGSTTERVIHHAPCPVLVVRAG